MSRTKIKAATIFFTLFTIISLVYLAYASQLPTEEVLSTILCDYTQEGTYDYIAKLKQPNLIYDNKATLVSGEGTVYTPMTEYINVTFTYIFESNLNANSTIKYTTSEYVITPRWTKQTFTIPQQTIQDVANKTSFSVSIPPIDPKSIGTLVSNINSEIGVSTGNYNMTITTTIILNAETTAGTINEPFTATLNLAFLRGTTEGDIVLIENLQTTKTGEITQTQTIYHNWVRNQQYASYMTSTIALVGLAISAFFYIKTKPPVAPATSEKLIQELMDPFEDIIVEAAQEPTPRGQTTVTMKTLEDLVKIADTLSKPIIHFQKPSAAETKEPIDIFYVLDDITRYEYHITSSMLKAAEEHVLEENEED